MSRQQRRTRRRRGKQTISLTEESCRGFEEQFEAFKRKFGREPGPGDPVFFDPTADLPRPVEIDKYLAEVVEVMAKAGTDPAIIYAFRRTGLIVTEGNRNLLSEGERRAWDAALVEYEELVKGKLL